MGPIKTKIQRSISEVKRGVECEASPIDQRREVRLCRPNAARIRSEEPRDEGPTIDQRNGAALCARSAARIHAEEARAPSRLEHINRVDGTRTRVTGLRGQCPRPLDDYPLAGWLGFEPRFTGSEPVFLPVRRPPNCVVLF